MEVARKLGYQPFAPARLLRRGKSNIVLVVSRESVIYPGISLVIEQLATALAKIDFSLVWQFGYSTDDEHLAANLAPAAVVALVDETDIPTLASLQRFMAPIITLANHDWANAGPRAQVEYLLGQAQRPIVYAATEKLPLEHINRQRCEIVRQTCREHGLPEPRIVTISEEREKARQAVADLIAVQPLPFAICAYNDEVALAGLAALYDLGIAVPEQVSVIGHDDIPMAQLSVPPLTTIGIEASDLLERLIASVVSVCQGGPVLEPPPLKARVVVRGSA
ncbi:MAG TPA: LacI family DNA-binding transcriptional regulator [Ktedonobacteraceae bacterium]|nr:LacI family DNA-binding transcriptional regulator [Ktedonobacteraceae bacterium]